jgi:ABC-type antimicrobial peptide transport system permease subunit
MAAPVNSRFAPLGDRSVSAERITTPPISFLKDAWRRFKTNPAALFGAAVLVIMVLGAFIGPLLAKHTYSDQSIMLPPGGSKYA